MAFLLIFDSLLGFGLISTGAGTSSFTSSCTSSLGASVKTSSIGASSSTVSSASGLAHQSVVAGRQA